MQLPSLSFSSYLYLIIVSSFYSLVMCTVLLGSGTLYYSLTNLIANSATLLQKYTVFFGYCHSGKRTMTNV